MSVEPIISVLMPVYNGEKFLHEAIDSILNQTFKDFEFIIINDGSTDNTESIIKSYDDSRIVYIKNADNIKLIKTLNKGIDIARGKFIARMDADDVSLPQRLEEELNFMESHKDAVVVSSLVYILRKKAISKWDYFPVTTPAACRYCSMFRVPLSHPASFFRAETLKKYRYREDDAAEHIEAFVLWGDLALNSENMYVINKHLLQYRQNFSSICYTYTDLVTKNHCKQVQKMILSITNIDVDLDYIRSFYCAGYASISRIMFFSSVIHQIEKKYLQENRLSALEFSEIKKCTNEIIKGGLKNAFKTGNIGLKIFSLFLYFWYTVKS